MGFNNPLTGENGKLIYEQIQSPNFQTGVSGWIVRKDGTVEFNSGVFRGSISIGNSQELLIYSSAAPAAGTLIVALAGAAGNDGLGNSFPQGLSIQMAGQMVVLGFNLGAPLMYWLTGIATLLNNAAFQATVNGGIGTAAADTLVLKSSEDHTFLDYVAINLGGSSNDGTTQVANISEAYVDSGGVAHFYRQMGIGGTFDIGQIVAVHPGTGGSRGLLAVAETWQTPVVSALWTTTGLTNPVRYQIEGVGAGRRVRIDGEVLTTGAGPWPANATIFSLAAGYIPTRTHPFITRSDGTVAAGNSVVNVLSGSGSVQNGQVFTAANQRLWFDGVVFPLD